MPVWWLTSVRQSINSVLQWRSQSCSVQHFKHLTLFCSTPGGVIHETPWLSHLQNSFQRIWCQKPACAWLGRSRWQWSRTLLRSLCWKVVQLLWRPKVLPRLLLVQHMCQFCHKDWSIFYSSEQQHCCCCATTNVHVRSVLESLSESWGCIDAFSTCSIERCSDCICTVHQYISMSLVPLAAVLVNKSLWHEWPQESNVVALNCFACDKASAAMHDCANCVSCSRRFICWFSSWLGLGYTRVLGHQYLYIRVFIRIRVYMD